MQRHQRKNRYGTVIRQKTSKQFLNSKNKIRKELNFKSITKNTVTQRRFDDTTSPTGFHSSLSVDLQWSSSMVEKMCPSLLKNSTACLFDNKDKRCLTQTLVSRLCFVLVKILRRPVKRDQASLQFLLDDQKADTTEPLFQFLNADPLRVWTASYQTQHL